MAFTRRKILTLFFVFIFISMTIQFVTWYFHYWQIKDRASMVLDAVLGDEQHVEAERRVSAVSAHRLRMYEEKYNRQYCQENNIGDKSWAWITAIATENYATPAIAMGHTLNLFSCIEKKLVLIDEKAVTKSSRDQLKKVGFELIPVDTLNCEKIAEKYNLDIEGEIPGTHNRFYGWNQTQYSKLVYIDPDMLVLSNIDELFSMNASFGAALCSPPRAKDNWCFNAGLLIIKPSSAMFEEIVQSWVDAVRRESKCLDDQNFLFYFHTQNYGWEKLPFMYNVRWDIYYPMKVFHFAGVGKPWRYDRDGANQVVLTKEDMHELWWHYYKQALKTYKLE